jgi:hypothetical protein
MHAVAAGEVPRVMQMPIAWDRGGVMSRTTSEWSTPTAFAGVSLTIV